MVPRVGERKAKVRWEAMHYMAAFIAVMAGVVIKMGGQDDQVAWVMGWAITSAAVVGVGLVYGLRTGNWGVFRRR